MLVQNETMQVEPMTTIPSDEVSLRSVFSRYRPQILFTYLLFVVENLLLLAQPLVIGIAINDLFASSYRGLLLFLGQHSLHLAIGTTRQMYDTRVFTRIYTEVAGGLVLQQRRSGVATSSVVARSTLSREFVDFFERHVPIVMKSLFSIVGALLLLAWYDWLLVPICLGLLIPAAILNHRYGGQALFHSGQLHDQFEREVHIIGEGTNSQVRHHFSTLARCRVDLSDCEAINFALMELFVMGVIALSLVHYCLNATIQAGDVFAVFRYVLMFVVGLDSIPTIVGQLSRLRDIGTRMKPSGLKAATAGN